MARQAKTLVDIVAQKVDAGRGVVPFFEEGEGGYRPIHHTEFWQDTHAFARALLLSGVGASDCVAIHARPRYEWSVADMAAMVIGAISVGLDPSASANELAHLLSAASPSVVITDRPDVMTAAGRQSSNVIVIGASRAGGAKVATFRQLLSEHRDGPPVAVRATPDRIASVTFTSGTTGRPKGIPYTHAQLMTASRSMGELFGERLSRRCEPRRSERARGVMDMPAEAGGSHRTLSWLPLHNQTGRTLAMASYFLDVSQYYVEDPMTLPARIKEVEPTVLVAVPRVLEKMVTRVEQRLLERSAPTRVGLDLALSVAASPWTPKPLRRYLERAIVEPARDALFGPALELLLCGSAPLRPAVHRRMRSLGIEVLVAYGMTECAQLICVHPPGHARPGTVGAPTEGMEVRIADGGEICIRHSTVHERGWGAEEAAGRDDDGFLRTGDLGHMSGGHVVITGRLKEMIKTSTGLRVAPQAVEEAYLDIPGLEALVVVGDQRPYLTALAAVSPSLRRNMKARGRDLREHLLGELAARELRLSRQFRIRDVVILPRAPSREGGELTSTLKLRRAALVGRHAAAIDAMYQRGSSHRRPRVSAPPERAPLRPASRAATFDAVSVTTLRGEEMNHVQ